MLIYSKNNMMEVFKYFEEGFMLNIKENNEIGNWNS